nr:hypothetical protein [Tanacetum cinerariifolium]
MSTNQQLRGSSAASPQEGSIKDSLDASIEADIEVAIEADTKAGNEADAKADTKEIEEEQRAHEVRAVTTDTERANLLERVRPLELRGSSAASPQEGSIKDSLDASIEADIEVAIEADTKAGNEADAKADTKVDVEASTGATI